MRNEENGSAIQGANKGNRFLRLPGMKILIITEDVGKTAPGIVFGRLIKGLSLNNEVTVLTANVESDIDLSEVKKIVKSAKLEIHPRLFRLLISVFGLSPYDWFWAVSSTRRLTKQVTHEFDVVLSFLSYGHFAGLIAGHNFSRKHNIKHAVYSVDAIPPPVGWLEYDHYYRSLQKSISRYLRSVSFLFSLNQQMLNYQLKTFVPGKGLISGVIYTPGLNSRKIFPDTDLSTTNNFVYTGGIYGLRKADYLISGFRKLLETDPNSKLQFIGTQFLPEILASIKDLLGKQIEIIPYTRDLNPYYKDATALIDIDADIENDVFLSSKMPVYLMINRIIICETSLNSPSRQLFKGINSIFQCEHQSDQLCIAMKKAIAMKNNISFNDRNSVIQLFQIENIINELNQTLNEGLRKDHTKIGSAGLISGE